MKRIIFLVALGFSSNHLGAISAQALFSKITITSDQAICCKDTNNPGFFVFQYQKNVAVTFADNSAVTADFLEIIFNSKMQKSAHTVDKKNTKKRPVSELSNFKQVTFKNNVCIKNAQRSARADRAILYLQDQRCILEGNVKIVQTKEKKDDVPIEIESQKAEFNMLSGEVKFLGSSLSPVHTTVVLDGHPVLRSSKKDSKKEKKNKKK